MATIADRIARGEAWLAQHAADDPQREKAEKSLAELKRLQAGEPTLLCEKCGGRVYGFPALQPGHWTHISCVEESVR